jgi:hypothetical protein
MFQKELYNVESLCKYIQGTYTAKHLVLPGIVTVQCDLRW